MKKLLVMIISIMLLLAMVGGIASAVDINDSSVFIKQSKSDWCTWASVAMMMRRNAILDGNPYWNSITDATIHYSGGLRNDFTSCGYRIIGAFFSDRTNNKKSYLISMLKDHPEGVVCYMYPNGDNLVTHAVLVTDYNANEDMFYCADSYSSNSGRRLKITEAYLSGTTSNQIVNNFKKFWYISGGSCNLTASLGATQSTTYYTVTLMGNGGNPDSNTVRASAGSKISLPVPNAPAGYIFNGWFSAASGGTYISSGDSYTVNANSTLYAQWREITYNVSYNANGGNSAPGSQIKSHNKSLTLSNVKPTKSGYEFLGWSTSSAATVVSYKAGDIYNGNSDIVLYAVWKALPPSVVSSKTDIYLDYDTNKSETITLTLGGQLPDLYHLNASHNPALNVSWGEWNGNTCKLTISATEKAADTTDLVVTLKDQNNNVHATTTIKVFSAGKYCTITYNANGGYNTPSSHKVPYDHWGEASRITTAEPKKDGYTFIGWSTNKNDILPEYGYDDRNIQLKNDVTLYAIWHQTNFTITVIRDLNGGTGTEKQKVVNINLDNYKFDNKYSSQPRISITDTECGVYIDNSSDTLPTKDGYIFAGWKGVRKGLNDYFVNGLDIYSKNLLYIGFDYNSEVTLTATWIKKKWNGEVSENFAGGIGTKQDPYLIENVAQLAKLSHDVAAGTYYENTYFELINNIDMGSNSTWLPIGYNSSTPFKGNFNGNNYTIKNLAVHGISNDYQFLGLFGYCDGAVIENIVFEKVKITSSFKTYAGAVAGEVGNSTIIKNISVSKSDNDFNAGQNHITAGDIVGCAIDGTVLRGCYSYQADISVTTSGNIYAGGIAGYISKATIENCCSDEATIYTIGANLTHWLGGIVGKSYSGSTVSNSLSKSGGYRGKNDLSHTYAGGIVGENEGNVFACLMDNCTVSSVGYWASYAGGIAGKNSDNGYIDNCISAPYTLWSDTTTESMEANYECVGYIVASNSGDLYVNYYCNVNNSITGVKKYTTGRSRTQAQLILELQSIFGNFNGFSNYESGYGTLWKKSTNTFPTMYNPANFKTIRIASVENGAITTNVTRAEVGTVVNITATPNSGYHLEEVYVNGKLQTDNTKFTISDNSVITPIFKLDENPLFNIYSQKCDNGVISLSASTGYSGDIITVSTTPDEKYILEAIFVDGIEITGNTFEVTDNHIVTAVFTEKTYDITVTNHIGGSIILDKTSAKYGEVVKVTIQANDGYRLERTLVDGEAILGDEFTVTGDHNVSCEWICADIMCSVDVQDCDNGRIEVDSTVSRMGSIIPVYVIPESGYKLGQIYVNDIALDGNMFVLLKDSVITATFIKINSDTVSVTGVSLNKTSTTLTVGGTETLIATVVPTNATNKNFSWTSSNTNVAIVSNGVVTAKAAGTATITVETADGNKTATCEVTVNAPVDENTPNINIVGATGKAGNTVDVVIEISNNPGIAYLGFDLGYNSSVMTLQSVIGNDVFVTADFIAGDLDKNPYTVLAANYTGNKTNNGKFVTATFLIKEDCAEGTYEITITNPQAYNIDETEKTFSVTNGVITVKNVDAGDVTGDGKINGMDLLRLGKYFAGWAVEIVEAGADATCDGKINGMDLLRLGKYFAGWDVKLGK